MLTLPIKKPWFDMILSGEKKEEYREIKPYYTKRFQKILAPYYLDNNNFWDRQWMEECSAGWFSTDTFQVVFRNGYSSDSPSFVATVALSVGCGKEKWGAEPGALYYVLTVNELFPS